MDKKIRYIIYGGILGFIFLLIIQITPLFLCRYKSDMGCLFLLILPQTLALWVLGPLSNFVTGIFLLIANIILYISIGGFIGWVVFIIRDKKDNKKDEDKSRPKMIKTNKKTTKNKLSKKK